MVRFGFTLPALFLFWFASLSAFCSDTVGDAKLEVVAALMMQREQDLDFGEGVGGDGPKIVSPKDGARFAITGEPHRAFTILLPTSVSLRDSTGGKESLKVEDFNSTPTGEGKLDGQGRGNLNVGATREAIASALPAGDYVGDFTITVTYQ